MTAEIVQLNPHSGDAVESLQGSPVEGRVLLEELIEALALPHDRDEIATALPYNTSQLELVDILNVMARLGCPADPVELRLRDIDPRLLPCLFVDKRGKRMHVVTEPSRKRKSGTAYFFRDPERRQAQGDADEKDLSGRGWFMATLNRFRGLVLRVIAASLFLNLAALGLPIFLMVIYDRAVDISDPKSIYVLGAGALILLAAEWALRRKRSRYLCWLGARFDHLLGSSVFEKLLNLPASAIERASVAGQVSRLKNHEFFREFFTGSLCLTFLDLPFTILAVGLLAAIAGTVALVPVSAAVVLLGLLAVFRPRIQDAMLRAARSRAGAQAHQIELIEKIQALRVNGMCEGWLDRFRDISADGSMQLLKSQNLANILDTTVRAVTLLAGLGVIYLGVTKVWTGTLSGGALFASLLLVWRMLAPVQTLCSNVPRLLQLQRTLGQIDRLMAIDSERDSAPGLAKLSKVDGRLRFSNVGLRYSKDSDPVFAGLSFEAQRGQLIGIAGDNGGGKSTILKLALGLYRPQAGAIYLDDCDIRQIDPAQLRRWIAYVPQIPEMFEGSIAENIALTNPTPSEDDIQRALRASGIHDAVMALPEGLHTPVRCEGDALDAGLIFGISLARALVKNAPILLIDELPYAYLNSDAGAWLIDSIREAHGDRTILLVTHRDDHLRLADQAVGLLEGGRTVTGTPEMVIKALQAEANQPHHTNRRRMA